MKRLIWLDDLRDPNTSDWIKRFAPEFIGNGQIIWLKSYSEFTNWIVELGLPDKICFDHDLADVVSDVEKTGYDCAKWLVDWCIDNDLDLPDWSIQSSNPVGKANIDGIFKSYIKSRK